MEAECAYSGFIHLRRVGYDCATRRLRVEDTVSGGAGNHTLEQFWHFGSDGARERMKVTDPVGEFTAWASTALLEKHPAPAAVVTRQGTLPQTMVAEFQL